MNEAIPFNRNCSCGSMRFERNGILLCARCDGVQPTDQEAMEVSE